MPTLLISLGTSPAVVPEAFLLPEIEFDRVHVLTTASPKIDTNFIASWFRDHAPTTHLSISRVSGFSDLKNQEDHERFEEVLLRWWLEATAEQGAPGRRDLPYACLSGGFKTMSAAMQKAAGIMGSAGVFHVLAEPGASGHPSSAEDIRQALAENRLNWIRMGPQEGWPQFHAVDPALHPLETESAEGAVRWVSAPDRQLSARVNEITARRHNIERSWDQLAGLPFNTLATWATADLDWLRQPLDPDSEQDKAWLASLPKIELHCHLGGFATHGPLLQEVRDAAIDPTALPQTALPSLPEDWPLPKTAVSLEEYMHLGDANGSALLKDPGCLKRQCQLLYQHFQSQNIVYAEVRCSPGNYADPQSGRSPWRVLQDIKTTFDECMVGAAVPGAPSVGATFQVAPPVGLPFQVAPAVGTAFQGVPTTTPAQHFKPYDRSAGHIQTWRDLPHRQQQGCTAFTTFRLADSLPAAKLKRWERERQDFLEQHPKPWTDQLWRTYKQRFPDRLESWLDEAQGSCVLRNSEVADLVETALRHFDGDRYILDEFVIMPNHVHVLVKPLPGHGLDGILHSWKSFTAKGINRIRGSKGQVWEHESFDHLVRSGEQLEKLRGYIRRNPEKAGLNDGFVAGKGRGVVVVGAAVPGAPSVGATFQVAPVAGTAFQCVPPAARKMPAATAGAPGTAAPTYPLVEYLRAGVKVTVNTDNIGISAASLSDNLLLAARLCPGLTRMDVLRMLANAVDTAFLHAGGRDELRAMIDGCLPHPLRRESGGENRGPA